MKRTLGDGYELDDDPARIDREAMHRYLSEESYWAKGRSREVQDDLIDNATRVVGLLAKNAQARTRPPGHSGRRRLSSGRRQHGKPERLGRPSHLSVVGDDGFERFAELERGCDVDGVKAAHPSFELACKAEQLVIELDQVDPVESSSSPDDRFASVRGDCPNHLGPSERT